MDSISGVQKSTFEVEENRTKFFDQNVDFVYAKEQFR